MNHATDAPKQVFDRTRRVDVLLDVIRAVVIEVRPGAQAPAVVSLDATLDRDLGLDSLARVELLLRIERAFGVTLPENTLQLAETPRDLLTTLRSASTRVGALPLATTRVAPMRPSEGAEAEPAHAATLLGVLDWHY